MVWTAHTQGLAGVGLALAITCASGSTSASSSQGSAAHTVGGVVFATGALITIAAFAIPLAVCKSSREVDSRGETIARENPCNNLTNGTKAAWVAGAGVGLALAVFGGILYFETEPKSSSSSTVRLNIVPWASRGPEGRGPLLAEGGLSLAVSF